MSQATFMTGLWPSSQSVLPIGASQMLALLAVLLAAFLLLKFMNDDHQKRLLLEQEKTNKRRRKSREINNNEELKGAEMEQQEEEQELYEFREKSRPADPVFIAPPPPHDDMDHPLPVICVLEKTTPSDEFGFNLHAEKGRGHFIGTVDHGGIGDRAGLMISQRIVGVNGTLVYPTTPHKEVVALIKKSPLSTTLLLASEDVDQWYKDHKKEFSFDEARRALEPEQPLSPHSIQISDEEILEEHPSPAPRHAEEAPVVHYEAPPMAQYDLVPADDGDETDIMAAVFGAVPLPVIGAGVELAAAEPVPEPREQQHLVEHAGHHEPALVAEHLPEEEHHHIEEHVPAYNAYASPPLSEVHHHHHHHQQQQQHHDDHYHADYNHNGHSHDHYHNGKSNGYSSPNSVASSDQDIFHLSAKEARERLRQQKRRAQDMSLEEKYRLVSNM